MPNIEEVIAVYNYSLDKLHVKQKSKQIPIAHVRQL